MGKIENNPEFKELFKLLRQMSFIPFELNAKISGDMQLQITEAFEISYFDN